MIKDTPITVIGAGSWGTALAILLARNGQAVRLWDRDPKHISDLYHKNHNTRYLPSIAFPENLEVFCELAEALANVNDILIAIPSHAFHAVLEELKPFIHKGVRIAWGTKGFDPHGQRLLHKAVEEVLGVVPMAAISGPNFAKEVALDLPSATALASTNKKFATDMTARLHNPNFRVYITEDIIGVEVCGAVKNVLALAVGASDGLGFGANARCALITRGLAEMARLGMAMGGRQETFMGLAGVGDLVLTATDDQSRNRRFGLALGAGKDLEQVKQEINQVVEGVTNVQLVYQLAQHYQIEMPITEQLHRVLYQQLPIAEAVRALLSRFPKEE